MSKLPPVGSTQNQYQIKYDPDDTFLVIAHWMDQAVVVFPGDPLPHVFTADEFEPVEGEEDE